MARDIFAVAAARCGHPGCGVEMKEWCRAVASAIEGTDAVDFAAADRLTSADVAHWTFETTRLRAAFRRWFERRKGAAGGQ